MQVKRTKHESAFVVVPNAISQHRRLSLTARGLLVLLLSQPENTAATVAELTEDCSEGQRRITLAMKELQAAGYVTCKRLQNERGHWSTGVTIFDLPQSDAPKGDEPKAGKPKRRMAGLIPFGEKDQGKNPPTPKSDATATPSEDGHNEGRGEEAPQSQEIGHASSVLANLKTAAPALALSAADVLALAPMAAEWLARGVSPLQLRNELTEGLPANVKSARAIVASRLERKMPAVPAKADPLAECGGDCGRYLPRGQKTGICTQCAGVAPAATPQAATVGQSSESASLLAEIRSRRAAGRIKGKSHRGFATVAI